MKLIFLIIKMFYNSLFKYKKIKCNICKDTKQIEVLIMGTDTEIVDCYFCQK